MADPTVVALTQNDWVQGLARNNNRVSLHIQNLNGASELFYFDPVGDNPFALSFDGGTDFVDIDTILGSGSPILGSTSGSISARISRDTGGAGNDTIFSLGDTSANEFLQLFVDSSNQLHARLRTAAAVQWEVETDNAIPTAEFITVKLVHDGTEAKLFVRGTAVPQTFTTSLDKTKWVDDIDANVDNARLGSLSISGAGEAQFFLGDIDKVRIFAGTTSQVAPNNRQEVAIYAIGEGTLASASLTIADDSTNSFTGTLGVSTAAPSWVARSAGLKLGADTAIILDSNTKTVSHNAYWFNTAGSGVSAELQEKDNRET